MEYIIGILLLISFLGLVVYAVRGGNLMVGMLIMACIWTILPLIGNALVTNPAFLEANFKNASGEIVKPTIISVLTNVFQGGPEGWGPTLVNVIFGAWFGRVLLGTGIASSIIRKTVELGGDKPVLVCILLSVVVTGIFTSMYGAGAVVAIGVIVLPILFSLGIPKVLAVVSLMLSVGAGMFINPVQFSIVQGFFQNADGKPTYFYDSTFTHWGTIALCIQLAVTLLLIVTVMLRKKPAKAWAVQTAQSKEVEFVPGIALITPLLPVVLLIAFKIPIIMGFTIGSFFALAVCRKMKSYGDTCRIVSKYFLEGVQDTAPLVGFLLMVPMFNKASGLCVPYFKVLLGNIIPNNTLIISIAVAILAPLGLFRGPLTVFGGGAATLGILNAIGLPVGFVFPLLFTTSTVMNCSCCFTQSWIAWGINYSNVPGREFLKTSVVCGWIICVVNIAIIYFMFG